MGRWQEIAVETTEEAMEAVANLFYELGASGVVIEDPGVVARYLEEDLWDAYELPSTLLERENVIIKGYLPMDDELENRLKTFEKELLDLERFFVSWLAKVSYAEIAEADWSTAWKAYYKPEKIGNGVVVSPSWEEYEPKAGETVIWLDPGMAFGTGNHPTTSMMIRGIEKYLEQGNSVLDVGTGSGILAIVAAKLGAKQVLALDIDTLAVEIAQQNAELNGVAPLVTVRYNDLLTGLDDKFHLITANLTSDPILAMAEEVGDKLLPRGLFLASGIIKERYQEVAGKFLKLGYSLVEAPIEGEWVSLVLRKD